MTIRRRTAALGVAGGALALGAWLLWSPPPGPPAGPAVPELQRPAPGDTAAPLPAPVATAPLMAAVARGPAAASAAQPPPTLPADASRDVDLYVLVHTLREARSVGSFPAARRLVLACRDLRMVLGRPLEFWAQAGLPNSNPSPDGVRLLARQAAERRCARLIGDDAAELDRPLPGDAAGERYLNAVQANAGWPPDAEPLLATLREVSSQGLLVDATDALAAYGAWNGTHAGWQGAERENFSHALAMAQKIVRAESAAPADQEVRALLLLATCYAGGACVPAGIDPRWTPAEWPEARRAAVRRLGEAMAVALRANDVAAFVGRRP